MSTKILQRRLLLNAIDIREMEQLIDYYRQFKRESDESGLLKDEYKYHNALKYLRGELAKFVDEQRYLKSLLATYKKPKVSKKHGLGEQTK